MMQGTRAAAAGNSPPKNPARGKDSCCVRDCAMTLDGYNRFCATLPGATHVVQWGGAHVWKVGGKVFGIAVAGSGEEPYVTFKCTEMAFEVLNALPGLRPAPYLASRGMSWIQRQTGESMDDEALRDYLAASYRQVRAKLPKRLRAEIEVLAEKR